MIEYDIKIFVGYTIPEEKIRTWLKNNKNNKF